MAEISDKLQHLTDTDIALEFRQSLIALLPILQRLDCVEDDTSHYDPFDRVAEVLWDELVLESFKWKYGLESKPNFPRYGYSGLAPQAHGYLQIRSEGRNLQFICFVGKRELGPEMFNAVLAADSTGRTLHVPVSSVDSFHWQRGASEA